MTSTNGHINWRSAEFLGKGFIDQQQEIVLEIGTDRWTRQEMVTDLGVANLAAARRLTNILNTELPSGQVPNAKQLADKVNFDDLLKIEGIGVTCVYVLLSAMDAKRININKWVGSMDITLHSEQMRARKELMARKENKRGQSKRKESKIAKKRDTGIQPS